MREVHSSPSPSFTVKASMPPSPTASGGAARVQKLHPVEVQEHRVGEYPSEGTAKIVGEDIEMKCVVPIPLEDVHERHGCIRTLHNTSRASNSRASLPVPLPTSRIRSTHADGLRNGVQEVSLRFTGAYGVASRYASAARSYASGVRRLADHSASLTKPVSQPGCESRGRPGRARMARRPRVARTPGRANEGGTRA